MDVDLPVWTIRPNWKGGILERLEWLTDVITSSVGAEQRRSLRLSPRRSFEFTVNPTSGERTFLDLILHRLGSEEWLLPLWHDKARLSVGAADGATRLNFDNNYREFLNGGLALLYQDTFNWEVVSISGQDALGLDLDVPLDAAWGPNSVVYPLRKTWVQGDTSLKNLTGRVGESVLLFTVNEPNDWPEIIPAVSHAGMPVISTPPNRSSEITSDQVRLIFDQDGQLGRRERIDNVGRAFSVQSHNWTLRGRQAHSGFRSLLYWLRGRQRAVWLPTFQDDVIATRDAAALATNLDIRKIGIGYVGGVIPGRDKVLLGGDVLTITDIGAPQSPSEERIRIGAGLPHAVPQGRSGSFLDAARLDTDTIELQHHTDSDGVMECATTWRTFSDTRDAAGAIYFPIPESTKSSFSCGSPEDANPCLKIKPEWEFRLAYKINRTGPGAQPTVLDCIPPSQFLGGRSEVEEQDPAQSYWSFLLYNDVPSDPLAAPGSGPHVWQIQFGAGSSAGTICSQPWPEDGFYCTAQVMAQHWTMDEMVNVSVTGQHYGIFPMFWTFNLPEADPDYFG